MRLLLDEMFDHEIARQLRRRGHDAVAVTERGDLRSRPDAEVFATAQQEWRAVVTENVDDYFDLDALYRARGEEHHGLVLTTGRRFPRGHRDIGPLVRALDELLSDPPAITSLPSFRYWLR